MLFILSIPPPSPPLLLSPSHSLPLSLTPPLPLSLTPPLPLSPSHSLTPPSPPLPLSPSHSLPLSPSTHSQVLQGLSTHLVDTLKGFAAASNLSSDTMVINYIPIIPAASLQCTCSLVHVLYGPVCVSPPSFLPPSSPPPLSSPPPPSSQHPGLSEFIGPLLAAEGVASNGLQWRLHEEIVAGFSILVYCLTSDQLYSKFVPLLFKIIAGKVGSRARLENGNSRGP